VDHHPKLSVIVPFFNEEESIRPLYSAIVTAVEPLGVSFEMVFVDDGSKDDTVRVATELAAADARVRVVKFRRNYGQTPAMAAGIEHATGEILITMDGDLQNDPADIRLFLDKMAEGYDIVVGWRFNRQDKLVSRKIPSRIANRLIGKVTGVPIKDNGCSLKAYRASLIRKYRFTPRCTVSFRRWPQLRVRESQRSRSTTMRGSSANPNTGCRESIRCCSICWSLRPLLHSPRGRSSGLFFCRCR
jgi:glycosyltransferase involved in cell wall biosynthesis